MGEFTKDHSAENPPRRYAAKGGTDAEVHVVLAGPVDLVDPSRLLSLCETRVLEVYTNERPITCGRCRSLDDTDT